MLWYMIVFLAGVMTGGYMFNKKLQRRVNKALSVLLHKGEDDDLYGEDD